MTRVADRAQLAFDELARLRRAAGEAAVIAKRDGVTLRMVTKIDGLDNALIEDLARWRGNAASGFANRFSVTIDGTKRWLCDLVLNAGDRILVLVLDRHGHRVGHIGLMYIDPAKGCATVDGVIRGLPTPHQPAVMRTAMEALIAWCFVTLQLKFLELFVLSDNIRALRLYSATGFRVVDLIPLVKCAGTDRIDWNPTDDPYMADRFFLKMERRAVLQDE